MKKQGFTLVEIMIVVLIIGLLAAIAIPNFRRARETTRQNTCINNLRLIDSAKQQLILADATADVSDSAALTPYLGRGADGVFPSCPAGGAYTPGDIDTLPACDYDSDDYPHVLPAD